MLTVVAASAIAGCTSAATPAGRPPARRGSDGASSAAPSRRGGRGTAGRAVLKASLERWHLRHAVSREVVLPEAGRLAIVGGLRRNDITTSSVTVVDPADGSVAGAPALARASHDAGGTIVAGRALLFGGGSAASGKWIQERGASGAWRVAGTLPSPRSDLAAVTIGSRAYVLGGYDGTRLDPSVLRASRDGHVVTIGRLPVPVRYAAVAAVGNDIWVVGGRARSGPTNVVQRVDAATGHASVVGRLHQSLAGASAVALGGQVYICGGIVGGRPTRQILRLTAPSGQVSPAGQLPTPASYAGAAVLGRNTGYLVGGETPAISTSVIRLRLTPAVAQGRR